MVHVAISIKFRLIAPYWGLTTLKTCQRRYSATVHLTKIVVYHSLYDMFLLLYFRDRAAYKDTHIACIGTGKCSLTSACVLKLHE